MKVSCSSVQIHYPVMVLYKKMKNSFGFPRLGSTGVDEMLVVDVVDADIV